jgi:hypothetical protein
MGSELADMIRWGGPPVYAAFSVWQFATMRNGLPMHRRRKALSLLAIGIALAALNLAGSYLGWSMSMALWLLTLQMIPSFILFGWEPKNDFDTKS